jgi:hypothetical protein
LSELLDVGFLVQNGGGVGLWSGEYLLKEYGNDSRLFGPSKYLTDIDLHLTIKELAPNKLLNPDLVELRS